MERKKPPGRKINLSLLLTQDIPCDVQSIHNIFPSGLFRFRFRQYVPTHNGKNHRLTTITKTRYDEIKAQFQEKGYEVGDWATPTPIEQKFNLASNVTRGRYLRMLRGDM